MNKHKMVDEIIEAKNKSKSKKSNLKLPPLTPDQLKRYKFNNKSYEDFLYERHF